MKTVTGRVVSSKPVSVSKAAKIMSEFAVMDHGASPSMRAYLKLTAGSLNDLVLFHKDLKAAASSKKDYSGGSHIAEGGAGGRVGINPVAYPEEEERMQGGRESTGGADDEQRVDARHHWDANAHIAVVDSDSRQRKKENKVGKGDEGIERTNGDGIGVRMVVGGSEGKKHYKEKKRYSGEDVERHMEVIGNSSAGIQDGQGGNGLKGIGSEEKKHKGKNKEGGVVNGEFGVNQDHQLSQNNSIYGKQWSKGLINERDDGERDQKVIVESRKRKNSEIQDAALVDSAEPQRPNKKKRKSEGYF